MASTAYLVVNSLGLLESGSLWWIQEVDETCCTRVGMSPNIRVYRAGGWSVGLAERQRLLGGGQNAAREPLSKDA